MPSNGMFHHKSFMNFFCRHTMVFIFYGLCVTIMLLIRPWLVHFFLPKTGGATVYAALYFFPVLAVLHAIFGGLICKFIIFLPLLGKYINNKYSFDTLCHLRLML